MIIFEQVTKKFLDGSIGLEDITIEIPQKDFVFLIGPSGAGKTTILKLINRELSLSSGEITVNDFKLAKIKRSKVPKLRREIGIVFQDFKLLNDRTVFENVALALQVLGVKDSKIRQQVMETLDTVGIADKAKHFPSQLSGGEIQRTSIARAIIGKPSILLADEPTGDLDPANSDLIIDLLENINKDLGTTVIVATHDVPIVDKRQRRVIHLENGKIISDKNKGKYGKD